MWVRVLNSGALLLGGVAWLVSAWLGWDGDPAPVSYAAGVVLLVLAFAAGGYALVPRAPLWLRLLVVVATPLVVAVVWQLVVDRMPSSPTVLLAGLVLVTVGAVGLARKAQQARAERLRVRPRAGRRARRE